MTQNTNNPAVTPSTNQTQTQTQTPTPQPVAAQPAKADAPKVETAEKK